MNFILHYHRIQAFYKVIHVCQLKVNVNVWKGLFKFLKEIGWSNPNFLIMINWWSMKCHWAKVIVSYQQTTQYNVFDIHNNKSYQSLLKSGHR